MNSNQCATLCEIFKKPTSQHVTIDNVLSLFNGLGLAYKQTKSGVLVNVNGLVWSTHRPHPTPQLQKAAVSNLRNILITANITPANVGCIC